MIALLVVFGLFTAWAVVDIVRIARSDPHEDCYEGDQRDMWGRPL